MARRHAVIAALMLPMAAQATPPPVELLVDSPERPSQQASRRLQMALAEAGCDARVRYGDAGASAELSFRYTEREGLAPPPVLIATNRDGDLPVPVWVTRRTAGVRSLAELQGRDLAVLAESDPVGNGSPLAALRAAGVAWSPEQLYETGDYDAALGLLLHNNTHAAASELGLVSRYLDNQGLAITWRGEPVPLGAWYTAQAVSAEARLCLDALGELHREDYPQAFRAFPGWIHSFRVP